MIQLTIISRLVLITIGTTVAVYAHDKKTCLIIAESLWRGTLCALLTLIVYVAISSGIN